MRSRSRRAEQIRKELEEAKRRLSAEEYAHLSARLLVELLRLESPRRYAIT